MDEIEFRHFLALLMCSDPWPDEVNQDVLWNWANKEAVNRGFDNWIDAYHRL